MLDQERISFSGRRSKPKIPLSSPSVPQDEVSIWRRTKLFDMADLCRSRFVRICGSNLCRSRFLQICGSNLCRSRFVRICESLDPWIANCRSLDLDVDSDPDTCILGSGLGLGLGIFGWHIGLISWVSSWARKP